MSLINVLVHKRESAATVTGETCFDTKIDTALMYKNIASGSLYPAYSCLQEHSLNVIEGHIVIENCMVCLVPFHMQLNLAAAMCMSTIGQPHLPPPVCSCTTSTQVDSSMT